MKNHCTKLLHFMQLSIALVLLLNFASCKNNEPDELQININSIIDTLSLEQKAEILIGTGFFFEISDSIKKLLPPMPPWPEREFIDSAYGIMAKRISKYVPGAAGFTAEFPELGITTQVLADGPAGLRITPFRTGDNRMFYCTAFPIATLLASTWDSKLIYEVGQAMGNEVLEYNTDIILGPGLNLQRDPLCGRNFEYYSEDPLITGKMAASMVNGIQSNGVGTSIKHFAANNQETSRMSVNTIVSQRALREIYLRGFEIAVTESQPWTVMSSYNQINGQYASHSHDLLTNILRNDWDFKGYVMTDWGAGSDVVEQMKAGNDLIMPGKDEQIKTLIEAVKTGKLDEAVLDKNLARVLTIMMESPKQKGYKPTNQPDLTAHALVARQAGSDGMVLLENHNNALPILPETKQVAVFGNSSYEFIPGGTGSGDVNEAYTVSLIDGLQNSGLQVDNELAKTYTNYINETRDKNTDKNNFWVILFHFKTPVAEMEVTAGLAKKMASKSEIALITIGRNSGEGSDRQPIEGDFYLTTTEIAMIKNVSEAFHAAGKKVIVVLNIGGVIETASWRDFPDAVLCAWQPGQEAGNSVVDVLTGKVNPSGKLAVTFPLKYSDSPTAKNFPGTAVDTTVKYDLSKMNSFSNTAPRIPWQVVYQEDIYVGYRYYNTFDIPVAYSFGYGLSYTDFAISNAVLSTKSFRDEITLKIEVKNIGGKAGKEVVQIYLDAPQDKLEKPKNVLIAFAKSKLLQPGESETLSFTIKARDLASFDEASSGWIAEAGTYILNIGKSSVDFQQSVSFEVKKDISAGIVSNSLVPEHEIKRLSQRK